MKARQTPPLRDQAPCLSSCYRNRKIHRQSWRKSVNVPNSSSGVGPHGVAGARSFRRLPQHPIWHGVRRRCGRGSMPQLAPEWRVNAQPRGPGRTPKAQRDDLFLMEAGSNSFEIHRRLLSLGLRAVVMESCHVGNPAGALEPGKSLTIKLKQLSVMLGKDLRALLSLPSNVETCVTHLQSLITAQCPDPTACNPP